MARIPFWQLFQVNPDGTLQALRRLKIGGFILEPGQRIQRGITFSGFDIFEYTGRDLEVDTPETNNDDNVEVVTGVY